ncbi:transposase [Azotobacter armeniacus]
MILEQRSSTPSPLGRGLRRGENSAPPLEPEYSERVLVNYPAKVAISKLVNSLKGAPNRRMKQLHSELITPAYRSNALWSSSISLET